MSMKLETQPAIRAGGEIVEIDDLLRSLVESRGFNAAVVAVIVINAVTLGLETWPAAMAAAGPLLVALDRAALAIFTVELGLKLWVYRRRFFTGGWNVFDLAVVAIAWFPAAGPLSVLRALRILRVLRLMSVVPQMRAVVGALFSALPGMGSIVAVLLLVFYVAAVMATKLFGAAFPQWFGSIGESMYSLFQIMTLESWSHGIVRPVMEVHPYAWAFFVPFVIVTSFAVLNLFIALIVNSLQSVHAQDRESAEAVAELAHNEREALMRELTALRADVQDLKEALASGKAGRGRYGG
jgi:voltage-gated sodium channel